VETCPACGHPFEAVRCPFCEASKSEVEDVSKKSMWVLGAGLAAGFLLDNSFPLLDWPLSAEGVGWVLLIVPLVFLTVPAIIKRPIVQEAARIKGMFVWVAGLLVMYVVFCFLNVILDKHPPIEVPARVVTKDVGTSRMGLTFYTLRLSLLWDQKQLEVGCRVSPQKFSDAEPGDLVHLVVHPGAFSLAWRGDVLVGE